MTQVAQGQTITLTAQWYAYAGGPAVDVSGLTIGITAPDSTVDVATTSTGITHVTTGVYQYTWAVPAAAVLGDHVAVWNATYNSNPVTASEVVTVLAASTATWAQIADVAAITGITVTQQQLAQANSIIEMFARRTAALGYANTGTRDQEWMKRAVAYEAVWLNGQPDLYTRLDVTMISEGRKSIGLKEQTLMIAPLARKALSRVSWLRTRSVHIRSPFQDGMTPISPDPDSAGNDFYEVWSPAGYGSWGGG
jgi:hypothetical protein